tara:strand:- start:1645 stop:2091 length:447 start_codon:yes stop_codon:yes gene_type:complete
MTQKILIINGPNLNLLGNRETDIYGSETLDDLKLRCNKRGDSLSISIDFRQSNHEGELVEWIQEAEKLSYSGIIINAGAYTHTSIAILDALRSIKKPIIEVHLSNIYKREDYRSRSYVSECADAIICGCGTIGYELAIEAIIKLAKNK